MLCEIGNIKSQTVVRLNTQHDATAAGAFIIYIVTGAGEHPGLVDIAAVIKFFDALVKNKVLKKPGGDESLRYLVMMTWIFCDNWLNFIEIQGNDINSEVLQEGYDHIIEMLYPYLTRQAQESIYESYELIQFHSIE